MLHPFFLILVHFRVTCGILSGYFWYSLWLQYMFVLHLVLYCFVQPSQRECFIPFLHDAFYILDLLSVGFNYNYVLVYGSSSSSNSLSLFFCLAQYNPQYFWYTFIPWKYTIDSYSFNFVYIFKYFFNSTKYILKVFLSHIVIYLEIYFAYL